MTELMNEAGRIVMEITTRALAAFNDRDAQFDHARATYARLAELDHDTFVAVVGGFSALAAGLVVALAELQEEPPEDVLQRTALAMAMYTADET